MATTNRFAGLNQKNIGQAGARGRNGAPSKFIAVLGVLAFLLLFLVQGRIAHAATITVNSAADVIADDGVCTLREAITAANTDTASGAAPGECPAGNGADTIVVPVGTYTLSIPGAGENANATGDLDVTADLTIIGAGAATTIIDGADLDRVFDIVSGTVEISGVTIRNGSSDGGGGILNFGTLTLNNSTVTGNTSSGGAGILNGGGGVLRLGRGTLILNNSTVSGNATTGGGPGGGISNGGDAALTNSSVTGNAVGCCTGGGGIYNRPEGNMTLTNVTVSGNSLIGIRNDGGTLTLNNSTVSGNTSNFQHGGGILNFGPLTLNNSTVSGNSANLPAGGSAGISSFVGTATLKNTIVANNSPNDCAGSITSAGHNLIENTSGCTIGGDTTGNITGSDPLLGPLADNGGPTFTHALLAGSPAIDAGSPDCPPPATDQRGFARPHGAACDIGAYEFGATGTITVNIDIKPGSFPNSINPKSKGKIPVAILSTADFNAPARVDTTSLAFGRSGNEASLAFCNTSGEDVNGDFLADLVCHFNTQTAAFQAGDTEGVLKGKTMTGSPFTGKDSVRTVPQ